MNELVTTV